MTPPEPDRARAAAGPAKTTGPAKATGPAKTTGPAKMAARTTAPQPIDASPNGFLARRSAGRQTTPQQAHPWRRRLVLGAVGLVLAVAAFWVATAFLPVWWAGSVGRQASGTVSGAIGWGVFYGFVFTFVPLLIISLAFARRWKSMGTRVTFAIVGVLLAIPNLITLGIVVGTGSVSRAAEQTLEVQAPTFVRTVLIAAIVAAFLAAVVWVLSAIRQRAVRELARLRAARDARGETGQNGRTGQNGKTTPASERTRGRT